MTDDARRKNLRDLVDQVRHILLHEWDPLGVGGMPGLADEYDFVLGKVMAQLARKPSPEAIADLLFEIERDYVCVPEPQRDVCRSAAASLARLRDAHEGWPNV